MKNNVNKMLTMLGTLVDYNGTIEQIEKGIIDLNNLFPDDQKLSKNQIDYVYLEACCNWVDIDQPLSDYDNHNIEIAKTKCLHNVN